MLHLHFGAGRLGLGLVAPFFEREGRELILLNRSISSAKPTGETSLSPHRRNELLRDGANRSYQIRTPGGSHSVPREAEYDHFVIYEDESVAASVAPLLEASLQATNGVVVTASLLQPANYGAVIRTLNLLTSDGAPGAPVGTIFFIAGENTFCSKDVLSHPAWSNLVTPETLERVICVRALVDRLCVGLEEATTETGATVVVRAEMFGSLKLELDGETEPLADLCSGSRIEFSRHVEVEKKIKGWLLNGSHSLIALSALESSHGHQELNLNQFLNASEENAAFAIQVMTEMKIGAGLILRSDPQYAAFNREVNVTRYLNDAASAILKRFFETEDPLTRILARFQAPTAEAYTSIEAFSRRFTDRVSEPMRAYEHEKGVAPPAASHSVFSMLQLVASGTFIGSRVH